MDGIKIKHKGASCWLNSGPIYRTVSVSHVFSKRKRMGHADGLLGRVCKWADERRKVLVLTVDDDAPSWLLDFYDKHGFSVIQNQPILMARRINGKRDKD